ncbi:MAG: hypothetical protein IPI04_02390 [Ignavibacteria bacterium]|nr:hypothetical protein [Ignavibacteria bacterium]
MKILKYIFLFLIISSVGYSQNVKITDFDIPVSSARKFLINGFYSWAETDPDDTTSAKTVTSNGRLEAIYSQFYSSPGMKWNLDFTGGLNTLRGDTTRYNYILATDYSKYFSNTKGFFANGELQSNYTRKREFGKDNRPEINLFAGVGYGRQVEATSLAKAIRIDQDLKKGGITSSYMPKSTMLKIAQIIDRESEYRDKYKALYESKIIEDIQKEIENSGVSKTQTLSALGFMRVRDVLYGTNQFIQPRLYGGDIRLGVGYTVLTRNEEIKSPSPTADLRARYAYPIGIEHQITTFANLSSPMDSNFAKLVTGNAGLNYYYNLTNRITFNAGYRAQLNQLYAGGGTTGLDKSAVDHFFSTGFTFYIENYISFNINGGIEKRHALDTRYFTNASVGFIIF